MGLRERWKARVKANLQQTFADHHRDDSQTQTSSEGDQIEDGNAPLHIAWQPRHRPVHATLAATKKAADDGGIMKGRKRPSPIKTCQQESMTGTPNQTPIHSNRQANRSTSESPQRRLQSPFRKRFSPSAHLRNTETFFDSTQRNLHQQYDTRSRDHIQSPSKRQVLTPLRSRPNPTSADMTGRHQLTAAPGSQYYRPCVTYAERVVVIGEKGESSTFPVTRIKGEEKNYESDRSARRQRAASKSPRRHRSLIPSCTSQRGAIRSLSPQRIRAPLNQQTQQKRQNYEQREPAHSLPASERLTHGEQRKPAQSPQAQGRKNFFHREQSISAHSASEMGGSPSPQRKRFSSAASLPPDHDETTNISLKSPQGAGRATSPRRRNPVIPAMSQCKLTERKEQAIPPPTQFPTSTKLGSARLPNDEKGVVGTARKGSQSLPLASSSARNRPTQAAGSTVRSASERNNCTRESTFPRSQASTQASRARTASIQQKQENGHTQSTKTIRQKLLSANARSLSPQRPQQKNGVIPTSAGAAISSSQTARPQNVLHSTGTTTAAVKSPQKFCPPQNSSLPSIISPSSPPHKSSLPSNISPSSPGAAGSHCVSTQQKESGRNTDLAVPSPQQQRRRQDIFRASISPAKCSSPNDRSLTIHFLPESFSDNLPASFSDKNASKAHWKVSVASPRSASPQRRPSPAKIRLVPAKTSMNQTSCSGQSMAVKTLGSASSPAARASYTVSPKQKDEAQNPRRRSVSPAKQSRLADNSVVTASLCTSPQQNTNGRRSDSRIPACLSPKKSRTEKPAATMPAGAESSVNPVTHQPNTNDGNCAEDLRQHDPPKRGFFLPKIDVTIRSPSSFRARHSSPQPRRVEDECATPSARNQAIAPPKVKSHSIETTHDECHSFDAYKTEMDTAWLSQITMTHGFSPRRRHIPPELYDDEFGDQQTKKDMFGEQSPERKRAPLSATGLLAEERAANLSEPKRQQMKPTQQQAKQTEKFADSYSESGGEQSLAEFRGEEDERCNSAFGFRFTRARFRAASQGRGVTSSSAESVEPSTGPSAVSTSCSGASPILPGEHKMMDDHLDARSRIQAAFRDRTPRVNCPHPATHESPSITSSITNDGLHSCSLERDQRESDQSVDSVPSQAKDSRARSARRTRLTHSAARATLKLDKKTKSAEQNSVDSSSETMQQSDQHTHTDQHDTESEPDERWARRLSTTFSLSNSLRQKRYYHDAAAPSSQQMQHNGTKKESHVQRALRSFSPPREPSTSLSADAMKSEKQIERKLRESFRCLSPVQERPSSQKERRADHREKRAREIVRSLSPRRERRTARSNKIRTESRLNETNERRTIRSISPRRKMSNRQKEENGREKEGKLERKTIRSLSPCRECIPSTERKVNKRNTDAPKEKGPRSLSPRDRNSSQYNDQQTESSDDSSSFMRWSKESSHSASLTGQSLKEISSSSLEIREEGSKFSGEAKQRGDPPIQRIKQITFATPSLTAIKGVTTGEPVTLDHRNLSSDKSMTRDDEAETGTDEELGDEVAEEGMNETTTDQFSDSESDDSDSGTLLEDCRLPVSPRSRSRSLSPRRVPSPRGRDLDNVELQKRRSASQSPSKEPRNNLLRCGSPQSLMVDVITKVTDNEQRSGESNTAREEDEDHGDEFSSRTSNSSSSRGRGTTTYQAKRPNDPPGATCQSKHDRYVSDDGQSSSNESDTNFVMDHPVFDAEPSHGRHKILHIIYDNRSATSSSDSILQLARRRDDRIPQNSNFHFVAITAPWKAIFDPEDESIEALYETQSPVYYLERLRPESDSHQISRDHTAVKCGADAPTEESNSLVDKTAGESSPPSPQANDQDNSRTKSSPRNDDRKNSSRGSRKSQKSPRQTANDKSRENHQFKQDDALEQRPSFFSCFTCSTY